jgi:hypothetical protein
MPSGVYKRSKEQLAKLSAALMGNQNAKGHSLGKGHPGQVPWNKGIHYPEKYRQKMSATTKAWWDKKKEHERQKADEGRIHWSRANIISKGRRRKIVQPPIFGWEGTTAPILEREEK